MKADEIRKMSPFPASGSSAFRMPDEGDYRSFQCAMLQEIAAQLAELNTNLTETGVCAVTGNYPIEVKVVGQN